MEIGAWVGNNGPATTQHMLGVTQAADRTGLASVWAADHLLWAPITLTETNDTPGSEGVPLHGTAERLVEVLTDYAEAGLQHLLMFNLCEPGRTVEQIERIASEVLPQVKGLVGRGAALSVSERGGGAT